MFRPHLSRSHSFIRLICFAICCSLILPVSTLVPGPKVEATSRATLASPRKADAKRAPAARKATPPQNMRWRDNELLIRFKEHVPVQKMHALLASNGARWAGLLRGQSGIERLTLPPGSDPEALAARLGRSELVDLVEPNYLITADQTATGTSPNDPRFAEQWALKNTFAPQAWGKTTGSKRTVIAIIDSGVDFTHPDLSQNRWDNSLEQADNLDEDGDGFNDDLHGWDFVTNSNVIVDGLGHGTAVAGIIAAQGDNKTGGAGVMWQAGLMSLRVLDQTGTGDVASAVEAIDYATMNGAQVINCSWGTGDASKALREAISRAGQRGVLVVASAGNSSLDIEAAPRYPASFDLPNLIAVAATDSSDVLAAFSNWGAAHAAIAAPGKDVLTTGMGGEYQLVSGTSSSAAFVSGVAGLIKTMRPWLGAERAREMIMRGARAIPSLSDKVAAKGMVSARGSLEQMSTLGESEGLGENIDTNGGEHGDNGNGRRNQRDDRVGRGNSRSAVNNRD
ncbi:MAG TPA: S8 family peptidase, partial [Pyrinomonadaceae bacterium]|nr:S8 family peptidase [Pyrinomonadaceae bacterium]